MRTIEDINNDLNLLWEKYFHAESNVFAPMQYKTPKLGSIVFVGMNPSFSPTGWKSILKHTKTPNLDISEFFRWPKSDIFDINIAHELDVYSLTHYSFFNQHRRLANDLKKEWEHLDLFAYRETNQNNFKTKILKQSNKFELNEFGMSQFSLFLEVLCLAKPSVIVVANAFAAKIYQQQRNLVFNEKLGYYEENIEGLNKTPVFFSGILTGGRALDTFSRERLFWQIKKTLNNYPST